MRDFAFDAPAPKAPGSFDRVVPVDATWRLIPDLSRAYGVTRIGDLTRLDRTGIPVVTAVVPCSHDTLSTYAGKGITLHDAWIGAVMEAVERVTCATCDLPTESLRLRELAETLDLEDIGIAEPTRDRPVECVEAYELVTRRSAWLPKAIVQCPYRGEYTVLSGSTNGLASGNTLLEAVFHAIMELIERHTKSLTELRAHVWPSIVRAALGKGEPAGTDDPVAREIAFPTGNALIDSLAKRIFDAGLILRLMILPSEWLPATMVATITDRGSDPPTCFGGSGCSWSPTHAAVRAITEAAQSRTVNFQAAREDISRAERPNPAFPHGVRIARLAEGAWPIDGPAATATLSSIPDLSKDDLRDEFAAAIDALKAIGIDKIYLSTFPVKHDSISVVRVVIPQLETYVVDGRIRKHGPMGFISQGAFGR